MARGRPDYWYGMLPGKAIFAAPQSSWYAVEQGDIGAGLNDDFIEYTVPEGFILHVTGGLISCDHPGIQKCAMNFSPALLGNVFYDQIFALPLNPSGTYDIEAGHTLYVRVYNEDEVTCNFLVSLIGFEETRL